jgi:hypothetical protein
MKRPAIFRKITRTAALLALLAALLVPLAGCDEAVPAPPTSGPLAVGTAMVPDIDLDVYACVRQPAPTQLPRELLGIADDLDAVSLATWGVVSGDTFTWGGALTMASPDEAAAVVSAVPDGTGVWTKQNGSTVYFVREGTPAAADMKAAIAEGRFVNYSFQQGIDALAFYPDGGATMALGAAVGAPDDALTGLITANATADTRTLITTLMKSAGLQVVAAGLYAAAPVDLRVLADSPSLSSLLEMDTGVLLSVKSKWPGIVVGMLAGSAVGGAGYEKGTLGDLEIYRGTLDTGGGTRVPVVIRISGNRIFAAVSGQESYAEELITSIRSP